MYELIMGLSISPNLTKEVEREGLILLPAIFFAGIFFLVFSALTGASLNRRFSLSFFFKVCLASPHLFFVANLAL